MRSFLLPIVATILVLPSAGSPKDFDYALIADDSMIGPGAFTPFTGFNQPAVSNGRVVFSAIHVGMLGTETGVYLWEDGELTLIADQRTRAPGQGTTVFSQLPIPVSFESDGVAIWAETSGGMGIYKYLDGQLSVVADFNTDIPGQMPGTTFDEVYAPWFCDSNMTSFRGNHAGGSGVYLQITDTLSVIADTTMQAPGTGLSFSSFYGLPAVEDGLVAFRAQTMSTDGLYSRQVSGPIQRIVDTTMTAPDGGTYVSFQLNTPLNVVGTTIAFGATTTAGAGYFLYDGTVTTIVDLTTTIANTGETVSDFTTQGFGFNGTSISFLASTPSTLFSLLTTLDGTLTEVNRDFAYGTYADSLDGDYLAFQSDYLWVGVPEYRWTAASGSWDSLSNWVFRRSPRTIVGTLIAPLIPSTIAGPSAPTLLRSLQLGGGGIQTDLVLRVEGSIDASDDVIIASGGRLSGTGLIRADTITITSGGELSARAGATVGLGATQVTNDGALSILGGALDVTGPLLSNGQITLGNAVLSAGGTTDHFGALVSTAGTAEIFGDFTIHPTASVETLTGSSLTFHDNVVSAGQMILGAGSTAVFVGDLTLDNPVIGSGALVAGSRLTRTALGVANLGGDLILGPGATFDVSVGGAIPGVEHHQFALGGTFTRDGTLNVDGTGMSVTPGDAIVLLTHQNASGTFSAVVDSTGIAWDVEYTTTATTLVPIFCFTDADGDGFGTGTAAVPAGSDCSAMANESRLDGDCDDSGTGAGVHPSATETWYDDVDQNCDGLNDHDQDGDGYVRTMSAGSEGGSAPNTGDCDDTDATIHPGAVELPDGLDNDCDGANEIPAPLPNDDVDGDGVPNAMDNCPVRANADQADGDGDGIGDVCEYPEPAAAPGTPDGGCAQARSTGWSMMLVVLWVMLRRRRP